MPVSGPVCERGDVLAGRGRGMGGVLVLVGAGGCGPGVVARNEGSGSAGAASSTGEGSSVGYSESDGGSTGEPSDASRFFGHHPFENPLLPFGERGNPGGTYSLMNFENLA